MPGGQDGGPHEDLAGQFDGPHQTHMSGSSHLAFVYDIQVGPSGQPSWNPLRPTKDSTCGARVGKPAPRAHSSPFVSPTIFHLQPIIPPFSAHPPPPPITPHNAHRCLVGPIKLPSGVLLGLTILPTRHPLWAHVGVLAGKYNAIFPLQIKWLAFG